MLRPWRERLFISLEPAAVHAVQVAGTLRRRVVAKHSSAADAARGASPWNGAVEALRAMLGAWDGVRGNASVVLCNCLVRYAVIPQAAETDDPEERIALAQHYFARVNGERVHGWNVKVADSGLASAIDQSLLEALQTCFGGRPGLRLRSVQPYLMAAYNAARSCLPRRGAWLVLADGERTCLALLAGRHWAGVTVVRGRALTDVDAAALLARERWRMPGGHVARPAVLLHSLCATADERYSMALSARDA